MDDGISQRVGSISESATMAVDARAKQLKAQGEPVIAYGAGEPDFPTPDHIVAAARAACADERFHRYSPAPGLPELREALVEKTERDSGYVVEPSQVVVANGGKQALFEACAVLLDPGDEVLLPAPYWVSYPEMIALAGGVSVVLPTGEAEGFKVTVDQLEAASTPRTKALMFTSPSNPTGAVYSPAEIQAIGRWAADKGVWVITDEIYEHLVYGDNLHASMPVEVPELAPRCVVVNGVAKTYAMTGWRVGWMLAPAHIAKAVANFQSHLCSNVANVSQMAALAAVTGDLEAVAQMREAFDRRRVKMHELLVAMDGITCMEPQGAFYAFPSVQGLIGTEIAGRPIDSSLTLAEVTLNEAKVALVPGEGFGAPGYLRLSFALGDDDLVEGLERLGELVAGAR